MRMRRAWVSVGGAAISVCAMPISSMSSETTALLELLGPVLFGVNGFGVRVEVGGDGAGEVALGLPWDEVPRSRYQPESARCRRAGHR